MADKIVDKEGNMIKYAPNNTFLTRRKLLKRLKEANMPVEIFDFIWQFVGQGKDCQKWGVDYNKGSIVYKNYCEGCVEDCLILGEYFMEMYKKKKKKKVKK